jgi:hypothetical protein
MATTNGNRKILDLKRWEMCSPAPSNTNAGALVISSRHNRQQQLYLNSASAHWLYNPNEDGWVQVPSGALAGTYGAGICGTATGVGPSGTATGGSTTALNTNLTLARDLRGYSIHITSGPGAGDVRSIASNTVGANGVVTVSSPFSAAITAASTYRLMTPRWYVLNAGTLAAGSFRYYDFALNSWTTLANTGLPATWGTDGKMIATPSWLDSDFVAFATGTATSGTTTTLVNTAKTWATNQWANRQVRITAGTGVGQFRSITSNTSNTLTVPTWTIAPDATSVYAIEGNDDFIYILGNNAVTMYRYSISSNTTTTLAPTAARAAAPGVGASGHWAWDVTDTAWQDEAEGRNGRRIYSFRGAGGAVLDYYDIGLNTWVSGVTYAPNAETFTTGSKYVYHDNYLYLHKDATGRWFRFNLVTHELEGWNTMNYPNGAAVLGDTAFDAVFRDGATHIEYVYMVLNTSNVMLRQMVI